MRFARWIPLSLVVLTLAPADAPALDIREARYEGRPHFLPDGRSRYQVRQWNDGEREPSDWAVEGVESAGEAVAAGSMLVVPHNTDVTVHEIHVEPLALSPGPGD